VLQFGKGVNLSRRHTRGVAAQVFSDSSTQTRIIMLSEDIEQ
jgi:hypothetical protein